MDRLFFNSILNFRHPSTKQGEEGQCLVCQQRTFKRKGLESSRSPEEDFIAGDGLLAPGTIEEPQPAFPTSLENYWIMRPQALPLHLFGDVQNWGVSVPLRKTECAGATCSSTGDYLLDKQTNESEGKRLAENGIKVKSVPPCPAFLVLVFE